MSKNIIFAQKMTKLRACQISQNKKTPCMLALKILIEVKCHKCNMPTISKILSYLFLDTCHFNLNFYVIYVICHFGRLPKV